MSNQYVTTPAAYELLGIKPTVVATIFVDETARSRQQYPFEKCLHPGDSFLVRFKKVNCKYERQYWQRKLNNAKQYWEREQECRYSTRNIPDKGVMVTRMEDDNPHRRLECQL